MDNCSQIFETLQTQLSSAFQVRRSDGICIIDTPFSYPDRRLLSAFVDISADGSLLLSDDGYAHSYARIAGVSNEVLKQVSTEITARIGVETSGNEVVSFASLPSELLSALVRLAEGSQGIANSISKKRLGESSSKLDRQIASALVEAGRVYKRRDRIPFGNYDVDVDYNVLPENDFQQLSLFTLSHRTRLRDVESIAFRVERILGSTPIPGYTNRVLAISDDSLLFSDQERWRRIQGAMKEVSVTVLPITKSSEIRHWLTA